MGILVQSLLGHHDERLTCGYAMGSRDDMFVVVGLRVSCVHSRLRLR
jgi:hypothetical protein